MCTLASLQNDFFSESGYLGIRFIKEVILSFQITCILVYLFVIKIALKFSVYKQIYLYMVVYCDH